MRWNFSNSRIASCSGETIPADDRISARGKHVIVLGGGDTGSDCVGTANRQGAKSVTQIELLPALPADAARSEPWPLYPAPVQNVQFAGGRLRAAVQHRDQSVCGRQESGQQREEALAPCRSIGARPTTGTREMVEVPGSEFELKADLVLLALGFVHVEQDGLIERFGAGS